MAPSKAKILIIDDEAGIRELLKSEFMAQGYAVDAAVDGEEGVERIRRRKYDVVITDIKMPKCDGMQVLSATRTLSPGTEVIMITGYATVENAVRAMKQGTYDFVQKPFNIDELSALVEKALEKSELKALVALYASSKAVFSSVSLEELFPVMVDLLKKALHAEEVALLLQDHQQQYYLAAASFSLVDYPDRASFVSLADRVSVGTRLLQAPLAITSESEAGKKLFSGLFQEYGPRSLMVHALRLKDANLGMLQLTRAAGNEFSASDLQNLSIFASQIAQSIATAQLYQKLEVKMSELENLKRQLTETLEPLQAGAGTEQKEEVSPE